MATATTTKEVADRIKDVLELLIESVPRKDIVDICKKKYGVGPTTVDNYIKRANKGFEKAIKARSLDTLNYIQVRFNKIYDMAMAQGKLKEANDALANLAKFSGLEPAKKVDSNVNIKDSSDLSDVSSADLISLVKKAGES